MGRAHRDQDRVLEWRKIAALAKVEFLLEIASEIVMPRKLNRWRKRGVSLHKHFARSFAASGASRHLRQKLKGPFARAEVGQMQRQIGVDNSDKRDIRKMQTLRNHLCADENVDLAGAKIS